MEFSRERIFVERMKAARQRKEREDQALHLRIPMTTMSLQPIAEVIRFGADKTENLQGVDREVGQAYQLLPFPQGVMAIT